MTLLETEHVRMQPVYEACAIECAHPRELVSKIYCMALLAGHEFLFFLGRYAPPSPPVNIL